MKHGNQKNDLTPLKEKGGTTIAETVSLYSLKVSMRRILGEITIKDFSFEQAGKNKYRVTRIN